MRFSIRHAERLADRVAWNADALVPAVAQDAESGRVLMLAWMNRAALIETLTSGQGVYWSRSRQQLWRKGERSGQQQRLVQLRLDCDGDSLLLQVEQDGVACHTGRRSCFYFTPAAEDAESAEAWVAADPVLVEPEALYGKK